MQNVSLANVAASLTSAGRAVNRTFTSAGLAAA
jgi:hypothetical protein